jgi:hypothetical protein
MKVPKNPFASWTPLVAMMRVRICVCIDPLDRIGFSKLGVVLIGKAGTIENVWASNVDQRS